MHLFYAPDITSTNYTLNEEESKHSVRVMRLTIGDKVILIDGKGGWYEGKIINDNPKQCIVNIIDIKKEVGKRNFRIHIAIAPTKNIDRLEWFTEKVTEIGIDEISIIHCQNSERTIVKTERLNKVVISAIKQSQKAYLPKINEIRDFKKFILSTTDFNGQKFIAHCHSSTNGNKIHIKNLYMEGNDTIILIGPEGDFSIEEVKLAVDSGFQEIGLGHSRLRTETAAIYACATINILNEK